MIGLSPAYFISRYTDEFTPANVAEGLSDISAIGYTGFQLEVFHRHNLELWLNGGTQQVGQQSDQLGLRPTTKAHVMWKSPAPGRRFTSNMLKVSTWFKNL